MKEKMISPIFSDGMIIQRESAFPFWSRKKAVVSFLGKTYEAQSIGDKWLVTLDPVKAGGPYTMSIDFGDEQTTINDIYAGDIWLCSGQSNMEMMMQRLRDDFPEEFALESYPPIRCFKVPQESDYSGPRDELSGGSWLTASAETLHEFSGTAWFFARKMYEKHNIPIGLVCTAWGGTPVETWMSKEALSAFPEKIANGNQYADVSKNEKIIKEASSAVEDWETRLRNDDIGLKEEWQKPQTDIRKWNEINLPGDFTDAGLDGFWGVIWLAKDFTVSKEFANTDAKLWLGTITNADTVYINGIEVGNTTYRFPPRKYLINTGLLKEGENRIVIRVTSYNGEGGVTKEKPFRIFTENKIIELSGKWKYKVAASTTARPAEFYLQRHPMGNFNAMIAPLLKYPVKGVIWYQGESNDTNPDEYAELFKLMIQDWRRKNRNDNLPFLFVQLPIWKEPSDNNEESSWAIIREAQAEALSLPATGMAAALDLGEWNDLHPINKKDVGARLFLAAQKVLYKEENTSPGPMIRLFEKKQSKLHIYFYNCGAGLKISGKTNTTYVTVTGDGGQFRLPVNIEGKDEISVDISAVKNPQKVLYAWAHNPIDRQLFNSDGLPVIPFRIKI